MPIIDLPSLSQSLRCLLVPLLPTLNTQGERPQHRLGLTMHMINSTTGGTNKAHSTQRFFGPYTFWMTILQTCHQRHVPRCLQSCMTGAPTQPSLLPHSPSHFVQCPFNLWVFSATKMELTMRAAIQAGRSGSPTSASWDEDTTENSVPITCHKPLQSHATLISCFNFNVVVLKVVFDGSQIRLQFWPHNLRLATA